MGREFSIGELVVELRQPTPGRAGEVLAQFHQLQKELEEEAIAADAAATKRLEQLHPLRATLQRIEDGELDPESDEATLARNAFVQRFEKHKAAHRADAMSIARKGDATRGLLILACLKTPALPRPEEGEPLIPYGYRVLGVLCDEHGAEEPHIKALTKLCLEHLEECHQPQTLVDMVEVVELLGNSEAATASSTDSPPPSTGSTDPEPTET